MDATNNFRALLWKDGSMHGVIDLIPAYLGFTAITLDWGSKILVNNAEQIACAGTDLNGNQMALLLSIDPDTDNDGLPDSWEMQYYGHLGVGKNDLEAGGGGLTNWQVYQQGTDPNDFYNGQAPTLVVVSGNNQTSEQNTVLPQPLVVSVYNANGSMLTNAAITFGGIVGEGQLSLASDGSSPASRLNVRSDSNGQATVWFVTPPAQPGVVTTSTITATAGTSAPAVPVVFMEQSEIGTTVPPEPPTNFVEVDNADGSHDLTWQNNAYNATSISINGRDQYGQWQVIGTLPPTCTSAHINPDGTFAQ